MNKYQEALDNIKSCNCTDCVCDDINTIQKLVDRATPRKVLDKNVKFYNEGELHIYDYTKGECPRCYNHIEYAHEPKLYCDNCGQALDWSDEE